MASPRLRAKLLTLLPKLAMLAFRAGRLRELLERNPEWASRSALLLLYDESGRLAFWLGFSNGQPVVKEVDPDNPPEATTEITMHIDTFIAILKGRLDFRTAYLHNLVRIKSNDGLPPTYHFLIWSSYIDKLVELLR